MRLNFLQRFIDILRGKYPYLWTVKLGKKYDEICSLGYNCEVSMRINNLLCRECNHYIFTYSYEHDRRLFLKAINNLTDIYNSNFSLKGYMLLSDEYQIAFHPRNEKALINSDGSINNDLLQKAVEELKSRVKYLGEKTSNLLTGGKRTLFVVKIKNTTVEEDKKYIENLFNVLKQNYKSNKFTLLCVLEQEYYQEFPTKALIVGESGVLCPRLVCEKVKYFAEDIDTIKGGDINGWVHILGQEYYKFFFIIHNPIYYIIKFFKRY